MTIMRIIPITMLIALALTGHAQPLTISPATVQTGETMQFRTRPGLGEADSGAEPFFQDGFESGAKTNRNGFRWGDATFVTVSDIRARSGSYALRFRFKARPVGQNNMAEQRFDMGRYLSELWLEYMLYVPANYVHRNDQPNNNTFLVFWLDRYDGPGTWHAAIELLRRSDLESEARILARKTTSNLVGNSRPEGIQWPRFIHPNGPVRIGEWTRIRVHLKASSSWSADNGVFELWADSTLVFGHYTARFHNFDTAIPDAALRRGYFMGWANSGFTEDTDFFIDDVKFYDRNPGW
jgi:hypothetical protein